MQGERLPLERIPRRSCVLLARRRIERRGATNNRDVVSEVAFGDIGNDARDVVTSARPHGQLEELVRTSLRIFCEEGAR